MRTWRDQESARAIQAELLAVQGDNIKLKMDNGREFIMPISRFHKDDQEYVKTWKEDMKDAADSGEAKSGIADSAIRRAIKVSATEKKGESKNEKSDKGRSKTSSMQYDFRLDIAAKAPKLSKVVVNYTIYKRKRTTDSKDKSSGDSRIEKITGNQKFDELEPGATRNFQSEAVTTVDSTEEYKEGKKKHEKRLSEEIVGIHIEVLVNGAKATSVEEPSGLLRNVEKDS